MSSKIPRGAQLPAETKKTGHKLESKDTAAVSAAVNTGQKSDGILKSQKENVPRKNVVPRVHKGVSTRYGQQAELKEQNQHLMASNEELQKNLTDTQQRIAELELQFSDLEKENAGLQKNLKDCHVLLVAAQIDPVVGQRVGEAAQQNEDQRKEVMSVSTDLLHKLKAFGDVASQQRARLAEIQTTMTELTTAREHMMQERENFSLEAAEMEKALKEAEALLL
ncbi:small kinetochore-associated protein [Chaetodon auriga]|uniref:small kinetochore-associated protein n=1 Tax=Chaetodon auriga TaxID=39042 RepID=UPI004032A1BC